MKNYSLFGLVSIIFCLLISGCAVMEWDYKHPSIKSGDSYALINEEDPQANYISSKIIGFCDNHSNCPDQLSTPVMKNYSGTESTFKLLYTLTPWGLATAPFADWTGRTIAVPSGQLGIIVYHSYKKVLKREKILSVERGNGKVTISWSCLNKYIQDENSSENNSITFESVNPTYLSNLNDGSIGNLYKVTYETHEWNDELWATLKSGEEYTLMLSKNKLIAPGGEVISGEKLGSARIPDGIDPVIDYEIVNEEGRYYGKEFVIDENCMFTIKNSDGEFLVKSVFKKPNLPN